MPSALKTLIPIPQPGELLVNPRTGVINTNWYLYFRRVDDHIREIEARLDTIDANYAALDARVTDLETP